MKQIADEARKISDELAQGRRFAKGHTVIALLNLTQRLALLVERMAKEIPFDD